MDSSGYDLAPLAVRDAEAIALLQNRLWRLTYAGLILTEVLDAHARASWSIH